MTVGLTASDPRLSTFLHPSAPSLPDLLVNEV
jgi:hypothetical protein